MMESELTGRKFCILPTSLTSPEQKLLGYFDTEDFGHSQSGNGVIDTHNLHLLCLVRRPLSLRLLGPPKLRLVRASCTLVFIQLPPNPFIPSITAVEPLSRMILAVLLVYFPQVGELVQVALVANSNIGDQPSDSASSKSSTGESETHDLVAGIIVEHAEVVCFDDVAFDTLAEGSLDCIAQCQRGCTHARVIPDHLLPYPAVLVGADAVQCAAEPSDIRWDILLARDSGLPGPVAADDDAFGCIGAIEVFLLSHAKLMLVAVDILASKGDTIGIHFHH